MNISWLTDDCEEELRFDVLRQAAQELLERSSTGMVTSLQHIQILGLYDWIEEDLPVIDKILRHLQAKGALPPPPDLLPAARASPGFA